MELIPDNYKESNVFADDGRRVMTSNLKPQFDVEKQQILFPKMVLARGLLGEYTTDDFEIKVMLHDQAVPDIQLIKCNLEDFGKLSFFKTKDHTYLILENVVFKYDSVFLDEDMEPLPG